MSNNETQVTAGDETAKVGVVGRTEVIAPFRAAGFAVFPVEPGPGAGAEVETLLDTGRYSRSATPCLVMLPMGAEQRGLERLREIVRRAVGADVFGRAHAPRGEATSVPFEGD